MMSKRLKFAVKGLGCAVLGCVIYDVNRCIKRLRKPLSTNFMNRRCEFIYIKHDYFREPVKDFLNKLFQEETRIYSVLYNLKKKLTFTKVNTKICGSTC